MAWEDILIFKGSCSCVYVSKIIWDTRNNLPCNCWQRRFDTVYRFSGDIVLAIVFMKWRYDPRTSCNTSSYNITHLSYNTSFNRVYVNYVSKLFEIKYVWIPFYLESLSFILISPSPLGWPKRNPIFVGLIKVRTFEPHACRSGVVQR